QKTIATIFEQQTNEISSVESKKLQVRADTNKIELEESQAEAIFDARTALPTTDLEASIEGLESTQAEKTNTITFQDNSEKIKADVFVELSENTKQLFERQILELSNKIYTDINRLIKNRKIQITEEKDFLSKQWILMQRAAILVALLALILVYIFTRQLSDKLKGRLHKLNVHLQTISEGEIPESPLDRERDELGASMKHIESIANELKQTALMAHLISEGKLETPIEVFKNQGILGEALRNMQSNLQNVAEQDELRTWQNEGLTLFAELLRNTENPQKLYDALTKNIVKYVKANYGATYIANTDDNVVPHLELKSSYAYDRKKYIQQQIYLGQGLVGQCWQEGETIRLLKVPADYLHIASGLGDDNPRSILIVPIKVANDVFGVIEVASMNIFSENEKLFLETVAEDIASAIYSIKANEKTRLLLAQSQTLTEQMTSKEEQMKKNINQLLQSQEELKKKNADMSALVDAIHKANIVAEFDKLGHFTYVNERFLEISGYKTNEVIGQHRSFYAPKDADPAEFNLLWSQLGQGVSIEKNVRRLRKNGSEFWLRAAFFPLMDEKGNLLKVTAICSDITDKMLKESKELEAQKNMGFRNIALEHSFYVFETNISFKIKSINLFAEENLHIHKDDYIGHHIDDLIIGRLDYKDLLRQLENKEVDEGILLLKAGEFSYRYVNFVIAGVKDKKGELETIFFIGSDITESKKKEIDLETRLKVLEAKNA
ncbi:MAG: PAS domain-containing protein, partial [Thermonemataceae bacterium]|nr:PAS domain-containing protein [Thermonemataceae bacterium]